MYYFSKTQQEQENLVQTIRSDTKKCNLKALTVKEIKPEVWSKICNTLKTQLQKIIQTLGQQHSKWHDYDKTVSNEASLSFSKYWKSVEHVYSFLKKSC